MTPELPNSRFLPATIALIILLLGVKTISLTESALAGERSATAPSSVAATTHAYSETTISPPVWRQAPHDHVLGLPDNEKVAADRKLADELEKEKANLDRQRSDLEAREASFRAASDALDLRMAALQSLDRKIMEAKAAHQVQDEAAWTGLVKVYEVMRPDQAAAIFNGLEIHVLLQLLDRMNERKAAPVLAAMQPERARIVTQMLAQHRLEDMSDPTHSGSPS